MKKAIICFLILTLVWSCTQKKNTQPVDLPEITVSILPQKYFVEQIAGNRYTINVMVKPGASPETYEPTHRQMVSLSNSVAYFRIGHIEFEKAWMDRITSPNQKMKVFDLSEGIELHHRNDENHHHDIAQHSGHSHSGIDPHIWMSPLLVKQIAANLKNAFVAIDPQNKTLYSKNYEKFISKVDRLHNETNSRLSKIQRRKFMIFHPALTYFAHDYNLEQIPLEIEGNEPSPGYLKQIIDRAKAENIRVILIQKQFDRENAQIVADETGAAILQFDPLAYNWLENMQEFTKQLMNELNR